MNKNKKCLECLKSLAGRQDKRFCDNHCRSNYHNRLYRDELNQMKKVNKILRRNRRILETIFLSGRSAAHKVSLINSGFDFDFFTHLHDAASGSQYRFCYEYGYTFLNEESIKLLCKKSLVL